MSTKGEQGKEPIEPDYDEDEEANTDQLEENPEEGREEMSNTTNNTF